MWNLKDAATPCLPYDDLAGPAAGYLHVDAGSRGLRHTHALDGIPYRSSFAVSLYIADAGRYREVGAAVYESCVLNKLALINISEPQRQEAIS